MVQIMFVYANAESSTNFKRSNPLKHSFNSIPREKPLETMLLVKVRLNIKTTRPYKKESDLQTVEELLSSLCYLLFKVSQLLL